MNPEYKPHELEKKWQSRWLEEKTFATGKGNEKYYLLEMFPYPSGKIHMGHVRNYSIGDVVARYKRMLGFDVLHPMGWDAFGMPAENAAIANKVHPAAWTSRNIDEMRTQLQRMGFSYDWDRELATCDPSYYRWEQLFFTQMLEKGLVYKKRSKVNWCEACQTVLANEQVEDGCCWRCGQETGDKDLNQWFFKITDYAEELLAGCDDLQGGWPERVITMQKNWIGKSVGAEIDFAVVDKDCKITVFTTRQDTLFGATFMSLAPDHPLAIELAQGTGQETAVAAFIEKMRLQEAPSDRDAATLEKEGVFTGSYSINPVTGRKMPIYLANFVLSGYGTGAVMAVPAHDQRDFEFAKMYDLPIVVVIQPEGELLDPALMSEAYTGSGRLINSAEFDGSENLAALDLIAAHLNEKNLGKKAVTYRLRDWGVSRQRYWGRRHKIPVIEDLGSGNLLDLKAYGLCGEPTVREVMVSGVDLVTFSGDKLLGGPQAGIVVGRKDLLDKMKKHPLNRALRIDKMTLAGLEAVLKCFLDPLTVVDKIPTLKMLTLSAAELKKRAQRLRRTISGILCRRPSATRSRISGCPVNPSKR